MGRYSAFISYSHADSAVAAWLHRSLESYRMPRALVGADGAEGKIERRLKPVFRDRDELAASADLGAELRAALAQSDHQIVICSERAAQSKWVNEEILAYKALHGERRTFALIVGGEPYDPTRECFPAALRFVVGPDGALTDTPAEPIAADIRPGKDGRRLALMKLLAGVTGARLADLVRRDEQRRRRRLYWIAGGSSSVAVVTAGLAVYANTQRIEANRQRVVAEQQRATAEASLDFLIGTFKIANPATENPRTISAVTLLDRVSGRVKVELKSQPAVSARLLRATGEIYGNLGLPKESERDLEAALKLTPEKGEARAAALIQLAALARNSGNSPGLVKYIAEARRAIDPSDRSTPLLSARITEMEGLLAYQRAKYGDSAALFQKTLVQLAALRPQLPTDQARVLMELGQSLLAAGAFRQADGAFAEAERIYVGLYGLVHATTARATQNRAVSLFEEGRLKEAAARAQQATSIYSKVLDPLHPSIADAELLQGRILHAERRYADAIAAFERASTIYLKLYGPTDYRVGDTAFYESGAWSDAGRPDRALAALQTAKHVYDVTYGAVDPDQVEVLKARARVYRAAGDKTLAATQCAAARALQQKVDAKGEDMEAVESLCLGLLAEPPTVSLRFSA